MTDTVLAAIVGGIAGIITGSVSSLLAPWANWGIEKRRIRQETRKDLIHNARRMIVDYRTVTDVLLGDKHFLQALNRNVGWLKIKPYIDPHVIQQVDQTAGFTIRSIQAQEALTAIEEDLIRIQKEWELV